MSVNNMLLDDDDDDPISMLNALKSTEVPDSTADQPTLHQHHDPTRRQREQEKSPFFETDKKEEIQPKPPQAIFPSSTTTLQQQVSFSNSNSNVASPTISVSPASSIGISTSTTSTIPSLVAPKYIPSVPVAAKKYMPSAKIQPPSSPAINVAASTMLSSSTTTTVVRAKSFPVIGVTGGPTAIPSLSRSSSFSSISLSQPQNNNNNNNNNSELKIKLTTRFETTAKASWEKFTVDVEADKIKLSFKDLCSGTVTALLSKHSNVAKDTSEGMVQLLGLLTDAVNGPPLCRRLVLGALTIPDFVNAKLSELLSDEQKAMHEKERQEHLLSRDQAFLFRQMMMPCGPFFKCRRCGSKECMMEQKQTSRGDEGSTCFITCTECGLKFKTRQ